MTAADEASEKPVRRRNSVATRARILHIATREFASKGYEGAGTDEIADRASINKRMIYHYFSSKELLYLAVLENAYLKARAAEEKLALDNMEPLKALQSFVEFTFDSFVRDRTFINLLATENRQKAKVLKKSSLVTSLNSAIIQAMGRILERGEAAGVVRPGLDPLQLWITLVGICYFFFSNIYTLSVILETEFDRPEVLAARRAHVVDFVMSAVRP
ncbi:TetR/AcrR family transcriptional regulator [Bosea sp. BK604]|uniref:TetR/AcrR family transcriptional regulator n=1 Tax=Bosea sp. BK604 TaxID=2512180 RepID=UPI0020BE2CFE|nr:TetR/AcrR family transcriptional regulator [Bosea sp. BK604]